MLYHISVILAHHTRKNVLKRKRYHDKLIDDLLLSFAHQSRSVLMLLETAYNVLLRDSSTDVRCSLAISGSWGDLAPFDDYTVAQSESIAVFCICVIAEIGNAKNNIIGVRSYIGCLFFIRGVGLI